MIIALLSDIHSNIEALNACLKHAAENGAERYAFLGDLVGYGANPEEVVAAVARCADQGAIAVKGNHDEAIEKRAAYMNDATKESIEWTRRASLGGRGSRRRRAASGRATPGPAATRQPRRSRCDRLRRGERRSPRA